MMISLPRQAQDGHSTQGKEPNPKEHYYRLSRALARLDSSALAFSARLLIFSAKRWACLLLRASRVRNMPFVCF